LFTILRAGCRWNLAEQGQGLLNILQCPGHSQQRVI
jgi:hypothetical protein